MKQNTLEIIKNSLSGIKYNACYLFGSHARGTANQHSDYDILIVIQDTISQPEKFEVINLIRNRIAPYLIPIDIVIKSIEEIERQKNISGSIVRNALSEAVPL